MGMHTSRADILPNKNSNLWEPDKKIVFLTFLLMAPTESKMLSKNGFSIGTISNLQLYKAISLNLEPRGLNDWTPC